MNYIVFDLEWNNVRGMKDFYVNYACPNEIIQIGAVKISRLGIIDEYTVDIKPTLYKRINPRIVALTGIRSRGMMSRTPFTQAIKEFKEWCGEDPVFCSWSSTDLSEIKNNIRYFNKKADTKWLENYFDIQLLFQKCLNIELQPSLKKASTIAGIPQIDASHNALTDAKLAGWIFLHLKNNFGMKDLDYINKTIGSKHCKLEEIRAINFSRYMKKIDKRKLTIKCPTCGRFVKTEKYTIAQDQYWGFGNCDKCKVYIRHKTRLKTDGDRFIYNSWNKIEENEVRQSNESK